MYKFECEICGKCCTPLSLSLYPWEKDLFENLPWFNHDLNLFPQIRIGINELEIQTNFMLNGNFTCPYLQGNSCKIHHKKPIACKAFPMKYDITRLHDYPALKVYGMSSDICVGKWGSLTPNPIELFGKQEMIHFSDMFPEVVQKWAAVNARLNAIENLAVVGLMSLGGFELGISESTKGKLKVMDVFQYMVESEILPVEFKKNIKNQSVDVLIMFLDDCYKSMEKKWVVSFGKNGYLFK